MEWRFRHDELMHALMSLLNMGVVPMTGSFMSRQVPHRLEKVLSSPKAGSVVLVAKRSRSDDTLARTVLGPSTCLQEMTMKPRNRKMEEGFNRGRTGSTPAKGLVAQCCHQSFHGTGVPERWRNRLSRPL